MEREPPKKPGVSQLLVVFLTVLIDLLGFGIVIPLLPIYSKAYGASEVELGLLFASMWVVGPVHVHAFAATFLVYSTLNIVVHAGLATRSPLLAPIDFLIRKHHAHHATDPRRNYSTLTPLPDLLFGTAL